jgi:hypothetical protein
MMTQTNHRRRKKKERENRKNRRFSNKPNRLRCTALRRQRRPVLLRGSSLRDCERARDFPLRRSDGVSSSASSSEVCEQAYCQPDYSRRESESEEFVPISAPLCHLIQNHYCNLRHSRLAVENPFDLKLRRLSCLLSALVDDGAADPSLLVSNRYLKGNEEGRSGKRRDREIRETRSVRCSPR